MNTPVRVAMWSGPRNISTAMMRAWENRDDCAGSDEPLYAHYLSHTGLDHPGREDVIGHGETDWREVVAALTGPVPEGRPVWYQKHMTHHLLAHIDHGWIAQLRNVLLIRVPREVVSSYVKSRASVTAQDIGLPQQIALYEELNASGEPPPVIDSGDFLRAPEAHLRALCAWLGIEFTQRMLRGRATVSGRRIGTRTYGSRPASRRRRLAKSNSPARLPKSRRNAVRITSGCTRCG